MEKFWILILVELIATYSLDKAESVKVKLEETPLKTFNEIFGEGWQDKGEAEDLKMSALTNFGQNVHQQIDRQNTQIGQIEPNSTDQLGQIEPNSTDQSENIAEEERKRKIVAKFHAVKDELMQKGKFPRQEKTQIEDKIAKHLKVSRSKIYKWQKELGLSQKFYEKKERKNLIEKFNQMKAELKRAGFKDSYHHEIDKTVAKELGITDRTISRWKSELGQTRTNYSDDEKLKIVKKFMRMKSGLSGENKKSCKEIDKEIAERFGVNVRTINQWKKEFGLSRRNPKHNEQKELMKIYYEIKDKNPKISDKNIAKMLKIGTSTLYNWKKQFKRQQFYTNSVGRLSVENSGSNLEEIGNSNSESI